MELIERFINSLTGQKNKHSKATIKNYRSDIRKFIAWYENTYENKFNPVAINTATIQSYITSFSADTAAQSIKRYQSSLRKFFTFLYHEKYIQINPCELPSPEKPIQDPWRVKEFKNHLYRSHASRPTIKNYTADIHQFIQWFMTVQQATKDATNNMVTIDLSLETIEAYKQRLISDTQLSPVSINRKLSSLRKYLNWLNGDADKENLFVANIAQTKTVPETLEPLRPTEVSKTPEQLLASIPQQAKEKPNKEGRYSRFGPVRFFQKTGHLLGLTIDTLFFLPVAKTVEAAQYALWKMNGKTIFAPLETFTDAAITTEQAITETKLAVAKNALKSGTAVLNTFFTKPLQTPRLQNIPKSVYAPLQISTKHLPWKQRVMHYLKHVRPAWYGHYHSYPLVHYFHFAILIIFMTGVGIGMYRGFVDGPRATKPILAAVPDSPPRLISFQGRLADTSDTPITAATPLRFSIYNSETASGSAKLWEEVQEVEPGINGEFSVFLGKNSPLLQHLFTDNTKLFLGIAVKNEEEMLPRQPLANVSYATNADTIQGMSAITAPDAGTKNVILALDSSGNLTIGGKASPTFQVTGGEFTLSGQTLTLATNQGSNTNVQIKPDGTGMIDLQKPLQNTSNNNNLASARGAVEVDDLFAILASSSGQSAFTLNQNGAGPLISASASGVAKFTVLNDGSGTFAGNLGVNGNSLSTTSQTFNLLNSGVINLNIGGNASGISIGGFAGNTTINHSLTVRGMSNFAGGATIPQGKTLSVLGSISSDLIPSESNKFSLGNGNTFWQNAYIGNLFTSPTASVSGFWQRNGTTLSPTDTTYNLSIGGKISFGIQTGSGTSIGVCKNTVDGISTGTEFRECDGTPGDIAEYYPADQDLYPGEIVAIKPNQTSQMITKSIAKYQKELISVVSTYPVGQFGKPLSSDTIPAEDRPTAIGLSGKVPVKVTTANGTIMPGDPITASDIPGIGMKATKSGRIIGYALETYDGSTKISAGVDQQETLRAKSLRRFNNDPRLPEDGVGKILVYLNPTWNNPELNLTESGDVHLAKAADGSYKVVSKDGEVIETETIADLGMFGSVQTGSISAKQIVTDSLSLTTENISIGGETLRDYIKQIVREVLGEMENTILPPTVVSPLAGGKTLKTDVITPLSSDSDIAISLTNDRVEVRNGASGSAVATIDNQGNASFSGTLRAKKIIADEIEGLPTASAGATYVTNVTNNIYNSIAATPSGAVNPTQAPTDNGTVISNLQQDPYAQNFANLATLSAQLTNTPTFQSDFGSFTKGLMVFGQTTLSDTSITGQLSVGGNMLLSESSINTIGTDLQIQPLRQGNLSIMGGLVAIDTDGNLTVGGNATFAKDLTVKGTFAAGIISPVGDQDLVMQLSGDKQKSFVIKDASGSGVLSVNQTGDIAASGSGTFAEVETQGFKIVRGVQADTSLTETEANGSAGSAVITAHETERTIINPHVKEDSLIYITATSNTGGMTPYVARQTAQNSKKKTKGSFTIQIPNEVSSNITVNWWIVN